MSISGAFAHIRSFIGYLVPLLVVVGAFVGYSIIVLPLVQAGTIDFPLADKLVKPQAEMTTAESVSRKACTDYAAGWKCDFTKLSDGPVSGQEWNFELGNTAAEYNQESQTYTARQKNVRIEGGALVLEAHREDLNDRQYSSARIHSKGKRSITYGTLEAEIKLPRGGGTWPAFWLLPEQGKYNFADYGIASNDKFRWAINGEIDIMESVGSRPNINFPIAHTYNKLMRKPHLTIVNVDDAYDRYHRYGVVKTPNEIKFTIDGESWASYKKPSNSPRDWPFDQAYYMIFNIALGGNWESIENINDAQSPWRMSVRSITYRPL